MDTETSILVLIGIAIYIAQVANATRIDPTKRWWWIFGAFIHGIPQFDIQDKRDEADKPSH
jgi:hypothetical protein